MRNVYKKKLKEKKLKGRDFMALKLLDQTKITALAPSLQTRLANAVLAEYPRSPDEIILFPTAIIWADELIRRWLNDIVHDHESKLAVVNVEVEPIK